MVAQCMYQQDLGTFPQMTLWLCKRVIIHKITYVAIACWDITDIAMAMFELERLQRAAYTDHRGNENNSNKGAADALGSVNNWNGGGICSIDGSIPPTKVRSSKLRNRT